jgi:hypothetical protein
MPAFGGTDPARSVVADQEGGPGKGLGGDTEVKEWSSGRSRRGGKAQGRRVRPYA